MEKLLPPTFIGRYRLDRLVVAHDDVTIWEATDAARGISVQLSIFERGSSVLDQGRTEGGMFVAVGSSPRAARLELVEDREEARAFPEPDARRRVWPWAVAGLACALTALAGWYVVSGRSRPVASETTITSAQLPAIAETTTTMSIAPAPVAAPPETVTAKPVAAPERHAVPAQRLQLPAPKPFKKARPQSSAATSFDPLTI
ncbi:MAG TPA: hypothetical protein VH054_29410 [Polyangiaceae bacterium]|nr:hypothetical protein [Polyangiaceae bacterium]